MGAINQLKRDVALLKDVINVEYKHVDTTLTTAGIQQVGNWYLLNGIAQGDADNMRNGNSVKMQRIDLKGAFDQSAAAANTSIRCIMIQDKMHTGAANPNILDYLETNTIYSMRNTDYSSRWRVFMDRVILLDPEHQQKPLSIHKVVKDHIKFDQIGSAATDITINPIYLYLLGSEPTNLPTVTYSSRLRYVDN